MAAPVLRILVFCSKPEYERKSNLLGYIVNRALVFIPTYNEKENVEPLCAGLLDLNLDLDIVFLDDNSPDGTGEILDRLAEKHPNVKIIHRSGKLGIGSAHFDGINWAYENGYDILVTMDSDFTHPPARVRDLLQESERRPDASIVLGSRFMRSNSLPGWNLLRRSLTNVGHILTRFLLGMRYDATGALRLYKLTNIPRHAFDVIQSRGYAFFFESLYIFHKNGFVIAEIPIELPARTYGSSKMTFAEVKRSVTLLFSTFFISIFNPEKFQVSEPLDPSLIDKSKVDPQGWDDYWSTKKQSGGILYDAVASLYRKLIIGPALAHSLNSHFTPGSRLLHAGCGSGQVDLSLKKKFRVIGFDISANALQYYKRTHGPESEVLHGSIFEIPLPDSSVDGIYNLGVMEHFSETEINQILKEFRRVVKPEGRIVIFWPPEFGFSVLFFKSLGWIFRNILGKKDVKFHPDEITRVQSRAHVERMVSDAGLKMESYYFGPRDMFTQVAVVCREPAVSTAQGIMTEANSSA